ncbi:unnamed protein product [Porites evermanni]|uniref:RRM domain-containing protein n=1 Tax=Porites evermanni TaxID=104178 RepID=A0ABN8MBT2_9CNID|nr:unnamed protein product [Porites evermanni]
MGAVKHPPVGVVTRVVKENLLLLCIIRQVNNNSQYIVLFIGDIEIAVAVKAETRVADVEAVAVVVAAVLVVTEVAVVVAGALVVTEGDEAAQEVVTGGGDVEAAVAVRAVQEALIKDAKVAGKEVQVTVQAQVNKEEEMSKKEVMATEALRELKPAEDITPEERDARTAFCMQLARNIRPRDLEEFFSKVGQVADVRIISDRNSRRSKGIAYVEFTDRSAVPLAINLSGQKLLGAPIMVMPTQAEKNRAAAEAEKLKQPPGPTRLYVGSLHFNINEQMIKAIFEPFGIVDSVQLIYDSETGRSKGYGFLQFRDAEAARQAMDQMNGFELAGRPMKVGPVTERGDSSSYSFLDDEEYEKGGVELNSTARAALMAKLSQGHSAGLSVPGVPAPVVGVQQAMTAPVSIPLPTPCIMLLNMFDPTKEKDVDWDADIRDDVLEECTKYGQVYHIHVDKSSTQGAVYVKCSSPEGAANASRALHGRWFAGKQIIARAVPLANYHTMFPQAMSLLKPLQPSTY